jgi:hypothetical protein
MPIPKTPEDELIGQVKSVIEEAGFVVACEQSER